MASDIELPADLPQQVQITLVFKRDSPNVPFVLAASQQAGYALTDLEVIYLLSDFTINSMRRVFPAISQQIGDREKRVEIVRAAGIPLPDLSGRNH